MAKTISLRALKPQKYPRGRYPTRHLVAGDYFTATPNDAKILKALGIAEDARAPVAIEPPPPSLGEKLRTSPSMELPSEQTDIEKLRHDAGELGIDVDMRWGARRLQSLIDEALRK